MSESNFWRGLAASFRELHKICAGKLAIEGLFLPVGSAKGVTVNYVWGLRCDPEWEKLFTELAVKASEGLQNPLFKQVDYQRGIWLTSLIIAMPDHFLPTRSGAMRNENPAAISAEYCERIAHAKEEPAISRFEIPDFRYFPANLWDKEGPKQWARIRLLQACERLNIPTKDWPQFADLMMPQKYGFEYPCGEPVAVPPFRPLYESEAEWRERAQVLFDAMLNKYGTFFRKEFDKQVQNGLLKKVPPTRNTSPLKLRYEWAARRYCLKDQFKQMSTDKYSADRIRKTVEGIFKEVGLADRK